MDVDADPFNEVPPCGRIATISGLDAVRLLIHGRADESA
jgi:hypothetical protein